MYIRDYLTNNRSRPGLRPGVEAFVPQWLVVHWTANTRLSATAVNHRNWINDGAPIEKDGKVKTYASAHCFIDSTTVAWFIPPNEPANHVNDRPRNWQRAPMRAAVMDGVKGNNPNRAGTVGFELCVNGGFEHPNFALMEKRAQREIAWNMHFYGLGIGKVVRHHDISLKDCPRMYLSEAKWNAFKNGVYIEYLKLSKHQHAAVNSKQLNVRTGPGVNFPVCCVLQQGEQVLAVENGDTWQEVLTGGWVNTKFLQFQPF